VPDLLNRPSFLALRPLHVEKECVVEIGLQPKKKLKFHAISLKGNWIVLDLLNRPSFLALRPLHVGKLAPVIILLSCVVETGLQPKKGWNFMQSAPRGIGPASRCKAPLRAGLHYGGEVHWSWKKGRFSIAIGRKCNSWPVGVYTRWRKQWWWTFLMDDKMTWPHTWRHFLELGFSGGGVSCPALHYGHWIEVQVGKCCMKQKTMSIPRQFKSILSYKVS
jgi:hypothetical protein